MKARAKLPMRLWASKSRSKVICRKFYVTLEKIVEQVFVSSKSLRLGLGWENDGDKLHRFLHICARDSNRTNTRSRNLSHANLGPKG